MVYGSGAVQYLCQFHLLMEYTGTTLGEAGWYEVSEADERVGNYTGVRRLWAKVLPHLSTGPV